MEMEGTPGMHYVLYIAVPLAQPLPAFLLVARLRHLVDGLRLCSENCMECSSEKVSGSPITGCGGNTRASTRPTDKC